MRLILSILKRQFVLIIFALVFFIHAIQDIGSFSWTDYIRYATALQTIILMFGLISVCVIIGLKPQGVTLHSIKLWCMAFIAVLGIIIAQAIYINPDGIFPWNQVTTHVVGSARVSKFNLYNQLIQQPEIVILGSSRAHLLPAHYLQQKLNQPTFNWSVEGGGALDALTITKFLLDEKKHVPKVLVVELFQILGSYNWQERTPIMMTPYLPNQDKVLESLQAKNLSILSYSTFAKASYTYINIWPRNHPDYFQPDGTSINAAVPSNYRDALKQQIPLKESILACTTLRPDGKAYTDALVQLADQYQFSIVFYISPLNSDFLDRLNLKAPVYQNCFKQMDDYMTSIMQRHPNVFYLDLLQYLPISNLRAKGYVDAEHINEYAGQLLVEALMPKVSSALQWTINTRK